MRLKDEEEVKEKEGWRGRIRGGGVAGRITREGDGAGVYPPLSTLPSSSSRAALQSGVTGSCKRLSFFISISVGTLYQSLYASSFQ